MEGELCRFEGMFRVIIADLLPFKHYESVFFQFEENYNKNELPV